MPARVFAAAVFVLLACPFPAAAQQEPAQASATSRPSASSLHSAANDAAIEASLAADPIAETIWIQQMTVALAGEPADLAEVQRHAAAVLRLRSERLSQRQPAWPDAQVDTFLPFLLIDQRRFIYDADFRAHVAPVVANGIAEAVPLSARRRMISRLRSFDFGLVERVEVAWGVAARASRSREVLFDAVDLEYGSKEAIRASIYSLPSAYFDFDEAAAFLRSVHAIAPQRDIVVLSNQPLIDELRPLVEGMPLHLIDTLGRAYSPWPRDPFVVAKSARGPVTLVVRPNLQAQRELDVFMARELVQNLPEDLDRQWQGVQWTLAPVPFHGGHMLTTPDATWLSIHTLMPRIKEILDVRGPLEVEQIFEPEQLAALLAATEVAIIEFEIVFGRPVRLVHALPPRHATDAQLAAFEAVLTGGDGRDLDSIVTMASLPEGGDVALVADLTLGRELLADARGDELERLRDLYHMVPSGNDLKRRLGDAQSSALNRLLDAFLDDTAAFLHDQGVAVHRVPLLHVPQEIIADEMRYSRDSFLISWNNVVLEETADGLRAEGFASGLTSADATAHDAFAAAGISLHYAAPLALSIMRDGGYRCASNHVR